MEGEIRVGWLAIIVGEMGNERAVGI